MHEVHALGIDLHHENDLLFYYKKLGKIVKEGGFEHVKKTNYSIFVCYGHGFWFSNDNLC